MTVAPDAVVALRDRLLDMRAELVARLADAAALDAGLLRLLADIEAVLAALKRDGGQ
jgi:hypothetical protein